MATSDTRKRFNTLFRQARNRGDEFFEFDGKRFTTELADSKKPKIEKDDAPMTKAEFLDMEARTKERDMAKDSTGKYDPQIANRIAIAKDADNRRRSQEGQFGTMAKGGKVKAKTGAKKYAGGGSVSSASKRADGCATKGKTKGRFV